jgi:hypothetical protein
MNREYDKEKTLACIQVMQAYVDGKTIQFLSSDNEWLDFKPTERLSWDWFKHTYRIKPEPTKKKLPLTQEDIPPVCWVRSRSDSRICHLIVCVDPQNIHLAYAKGPHCILYATLMEQCEYSTDLKNWQPCYKEVEE